MIEDKIMLLLKDISKLKSQLKEIKKDIRNEEKIEDPSYIQMKGALKDLRKQVKDLEAEFLADLESDKTYGELRMLKEKTEEKLAHSLERLFEMISELPQKAVQMKTETEEGLLRVDIMPEMTIYVNGKVEKPRL